MDYEVLRKRIEIIGKRIEELGGQVSELTIEDPATIEKVQQVESELGYELPLSFKKVITEFSSHFSFRWFFPDSKEFTKSTPQEFKLIFSGTPIWDINSLIEIDKYREGWIEHIFDDPHNKYHAHWYNKLAFSEIGNGDLLTFDLQDGEDPKIIYLSRDGDVGHGACMAHNFLELLDNWSRIAFVGTEHGQWTVFTESHASGIIPTSKPAIEFRNWLGMDI